MVARTLAALVALATAGVSVADDRAPPCNVRQAVTDQLVDELHLEFDHLAPIVEEALSEHHIKAFFSGTGKNEHVELVLDHVRKVPLPGAGDHLVDYLDERESGILTDLRSQLAEPWRIDERTVLAADIAYEIEYSVNPDLTSSGRLDAAIVASKLPEYEIREIYADTFSGFTGLVLEPKADVDEAPHRIYAIAGSHVFYHTDLRTWASGLTMARAQIVSGGALRMIRDAATYAQAGANGGEVFVTGQSQGGLASQGVGYLLQALLDAEQRPHHLVHVVSWGAVGAEEALVRMIEQHHDGNKRGFWPEFERHWSFTDPNYATEMAVWSTITRTWDHVPPPQAAIHIRDTASRMRIVGYFFEIDLFARGGTFLGTPMVFPTALVLPDACEELVSERVADTTAGAFGVSLESHFLNGYERAVARGAVGLSRPARPKKWPWVIDVLHAAENVGMVWLTNLYLTRVAGSDSNWRLCTESERWITDRNSDCEKAYWPGCSRDSDPAGAAGTRSPPGNWCLIEEGAITAYSDGDAGGGSQ